MIFHWLIIYFQLSYIFKECSSQDDDEGPYRGKLIGKLNTYHHQVSGEVYAVDDWTLLFVDFNYDGLGDDTFFWAGDSGRPGPQGFIVPDQHGKTNVLERYYNEDIRITLPEGKRISRIKWIAVYDIATQNAFGDVYIPDEFSAPSPRSLGPLSGTNAVSSKPVKVLDANTILIQEFRYDGSGEEVYFWCGVGPQPSSKGEKIPDDFGYLDPINVYNGTDVKLHIPGGKSIFQIDWFSIYDAARSQTLGSVLVPEALNVPPALEKLHAYKTVLQNCKQLHRDYQVSWDVFGSAITIELAAKIGPKEYMGFGLSGSDSKSEMLGADVAIAYYDEEMLRGFATDYNITAVAPCVRVLGRWEGVCRDDWLGGLDNNQVFSGSKDNGLTVIRYRKSLKAMESMDRDFATDKMAYIVWAIGALDEMREPTFHMLYHKRDVFFNLTANPPIDDCFPFAVGSALEGDNTPWERAQLFDPSLRVFDFRVGGAGGRKGTLGREGHSGGHSPLAWYVNGQLAPDIQLRRGLKYTFKVWGGSDPHSAMYYHPLIVTEESRGGLERDPATASPKPPLAGASSTRRGRLAPTAVGELCVGESSPTWDRRRDDTLPTFRAYNRTLQWKCDGTQPATLQIAPDTSWPNLVYYQSFTHTGMGGRIYIVDRHKRTLTKSSGWALVSSSVLLVISCISTILHTF